MKKLMFMVIIAALLFTAGCTNNKETDNTQDTETNQTESVSEAQSDTSTPNTDQTESDSDTQLEETSEENVNTIQSKLKGLTKDEYADIEITLAVAESENILPGAAFPVTITIKNNGDKTIAYTRGSGSYETPQALMLDAVDLQPILPTDYLGMATMDMRTEQFAPGEQLEYVLYVRAIKPSEDFNQYSYDVYSEDQSYIGDIEWENLKKTYPDLMTADPGAYDIHVYFMYYIMDTESQNLLFESTGYAEGILSISISD